MVKELRDHQLTIRIPRRIRKILNVQAAGEQGSVADVINNLLAQRYPARRGAGKKGGS
jgi:predicted HicB family RNase H-like nuclease